MLTNRSGWAIVAVTLVSLALAGCPEMTSGSGPSNNSQARVGTWSATSSSGDSEVTLHIKASSFRMVGFRAPTSAAGGATGARRSIATAQDSDQNPVWTVVDGTSGGSGSSVTFTITRLDLDGQIYEGASLNRALGGCSGTAITVDGGSTLGRDAAAALLRCLGGWSVSELTAGVVESPEEPSFSGAWELIAASHFDVGTGFRLVVFTSSDHVELYGFCNKECLPDKLESIADIAIDGTAITSWRYQAMRAYDRDNDGQYVLRDQASAEDLRDENAFMLDILPIHYTAGKEHLTWRSSTYMGGGGPDGESEERESEEVLYLRFVRTGRLAD